MGAPNGSLQLYQSTDLNAPVLTGENGKLVDLLTACLVDGYPTATVSALTRTGSVATATLAVANSTLRIGDWIQIAGAANAEWNGFYKLTGITDSTHVTFDCAGTETTPDGGGSITYRKSHLNWTKPYTGTNKAAFRSGDATSNQFYLQVIDNGTSPLVSALEAMIRGYESMTDVDTGTGAFPTAAQRTNGMGVRKSATANSTARAWTLIADTKTFYLRIATGDTGDMGAIWFGHFISYKSGDGYSTMVGGAATFNSATTHTPFSLNAPTGTSAQQQTVYAARDYAGASAVQIAGIAFSGSTTQVIGSNGNDGALYPNGPDTGLYVMPIFIAEWTGSNLHYRGRVPGMYAHIHKTGPTLQSHGDLVTSITGLSGVTLFACKVGSQNSAGLAHFDITGPWS